MSNIPPTPVIPSVAQHLPPDVLIEICSINAFYDAWEAFTQQSATGHVQDTISASHVCRSWRTTLLSTPKLWRHMIDPHNEFMAELMLKRSKPYTISFSLSKKLQRSRGETDFDEEMASEYRERLAAYQYTYERPKRSICPDPHVFISPIVPHLPCLEVLSISCVPPGSSTLRYLSKVFPGRTTPNLKRLHLSSWPLVTLGTPQLTVLGDSLTHLHVTECRQRAQDVVAVLASLGCLQSLALDHALNPGTDGNLLINNPPRLVQLREFRLRGNRSSDAASFLQYVRFAEVLSTFSFELNIEKGMELLNLGPDDALFESLAGILHIMLSSGPLWALEILCGSGVAYTDATGNIGVGNRKQPSPRRLFHVEFVPRPDEYSDGSYKYLYTDVNGDSLWMKYVNAFHSTLSKVSGYSRAESLSIYDYTQYFKNDVMMEILLQCHHVIRIAHIGTAIWEFLLESACSRPDDRDPDQEGRILPALEDMSFDIPGTHIGYPSTSDTDSTDSDASGNTPESPEDGDPQLTTASLYQVIQTLDPAPEGDPKDPEEPEEETSEAEDPTFQYEPGSSDYGDVQGGFYVEDLVEFCKKYANLRVVRFPELSDGVLEVLREHLEPIGVQTEVELSK